MLSIPFSGSKRYCYKTVKEIAQNGAYSAVFEPFGGSCVLSVNLLNDGVVSKAVANDYDHFFDNYGEYLNVKDWIVNEALKAGLRKNSNVKLDQRQCEILQGIISHVDRKWWPYLVRDGNFNFSRPYSNRRINLTDFVYFQSRLETAHQRQYLKALSNCQIVSMDWRDFLKAQDFCNDSLIIADPPYIGTLQGQYKRGFTLTETRELAETLIETNVDFLFFNSGIELVSSLFSGLNAEIRKVGNQTASPNKNRLDVMAYVQQTKRPEQTSFIASQLSMIGRIDD